MAAAANGHQNGEFKSATTEGVQTWNRGQSVCSSEDTGSHLQLCWCVQRSVWRPHTADKCIQNKCTSLREGSCFCCLLIHFNCSPRRVRDLRRHRLHMDAPYCEDKINKHQKRRKQRKDEAFVSFCPHSLFHFNYHTRIRYKCKRFTFTFPGCCFFQVIMHSLFQILTPQTSFNLRMLLMCRGCSQHSNVSDFFPSFSKHF